MVQQALDHLSRVDTGGLSITPTRSKRLRSSSYSVETLMTTSSALPSTHMSLLELNNNILL